MQLATNFNSVDHESSGNASHKPTNQPGISEQWQIQGVQSVQMDPFEESHFDEGFGPIDPCCVCHTTESTLVTRTGWARTPTTPPSPYIRTPL